MDPRRKGINAGADFVLFKVGSVAGVIEYADIGQPDPSQLQAFVTEAVDKGRGQANGHTDDILSQRSVPRLETADVNGFVNATLPGGAYMDLTGPN